MFQSTRSTTLMQGFDFNTTDLRANRMGMMSARQQQKLHAELPDHLTNLMLLAGVCWVAYMALSGFMVARHIAIMSAQGVLAGVLLLLTGYGVGLMAKRWWRLVQEIRSANVEMVTGEFQVVFFYHRHQQGHYRILVAERELDISEQGFAALDQSRRYKFYVTPASALVLSAELVK